MEVGKRQTARIAATVFCVAAMLLAICFAAPAGKAYADDNATSYTVTVTTNTQDITVATSAFDVSVDLARNDATEYPMYALGATIKWDNTQIELVDFDPGDLDAYVTDYDGYSVIVLNYMSESLEGTTWKSPQTILKMTFTPKWAGTSSITVERINISNSTGLGRFKCTSTDASVTVNAAGGFSPKPDSSSADDTANTAASSNTATGDTATSSIATGVTATSNPVASAVSAMGDGFSIVIVAVLAAIVASAVLVVRRKRAK